MILQKETIALFENNEIRRERYNEERMFSVVDIVNILSSSQSKDKWAYRRKLKQRLDAEWSEIVTNCHELKFLAADNKKYPGDAANTKTILRIIQSIPSPNAEPMKQRLASLWNERVEETNDPELWMQRSRERAIEVYKNRWMDDTEIKQRLEWIDVRHDYTDELKKRWISKWFEYALLTNISYNRSGKSAKEYRNHKWLIKWDSLRDHMSSMEMILTWLSEEAWKEIVKSKNSQWFNEVQDSLTKWAEVAKKAKESLENQLWKSILDTDNRLTDKQRVLRDKAKSQENLGYNKN